MIDPIPADTRSSSHGTRAPIVVLLVDDQPFTGSVVGMLLESERDIELHCCLAALDAIDQADSIAPTVILQDLVMPDMDGLAVLGLFRINPRTAGTPVVVLSGNDDAATRSRALAAGADGYIVKIPPKAELIDCIRQQATRSAAGRQTLDGTVIDQFREAGAPEFLRRLMTQFLEEARARVAMLADAARRSDNTAMHAAAHGLKGSAMTMGAVRLGTLCARVEDQAVAAMAIGVAPGLLSAIDQELVLVEHALAEQRERIGPL